VLCVTKHFSNSATSYNCSITITGPLLSRTFNDFLLTIGCVQVVLAVGYVQVVLALDDVQVVLDVGYLQVVLAAGYV